MFTIFVQPKISERDLEREQLRRENQHLRELLNAMHQERVLETQVGEWRRLRAFWKVDIDELHANSNSFPITFVFSTGNYGSPRTD